uniref:hypothetical protein n=1 Tax=Candidatus Enterovibrio escicola TaxID=1927127 RepID=UPI001CC23EA1|nr:hypothetical protein [Candidatus Enterovibrio escacola]
MYQLYGQFSGGAHRVFISTKKADRFDLISKLLCRSEVYSVLTVTTGERISMSILLTYYEEINSEIGILGMFIKTPNLTPYRVRNES